MTHGRAIALIGGDLALDFANTVGWHAGEDRIEHLPEYAEFVLWAARAGAVTAARAAALQREAQRHPSRAGRALAQALRLRETVFRVFGAIAQRRTPPAADLLQLHRARVDALRKADPRWSGTGMVLEWPDDPRDLLRPLYPIALAADALLTAPRLARVRQCGNHPCGWLFVDTSRNGTRRWCSAEECGNITRVRRYRSRRA